MSLQVPACKECGSDMMMPRIVFFGDNVNRQKVQYLREKVDECDAILVLGSSLQVNWFGGGLLLFVKSLNFINFCTSFKAFEG